MYTTSTMLTVKFRCNRCGVKGSAQVGARASEQDLLEWMGRVKAAVNMAHAVLSLLCDSPVVDLAIPMPLEDDPDPWVGKANSVGISDDPWKDK
jgi:hypothetical protein